MLEIVTAERFIKPLSSGRNKPCLIEARKPNEAHVEVVVKFLKACERGRRAFIVEAIAAMLAADLRLPIPEPFLVQVEADFAESIPDPEYNHIARASLGFNFGSAFRSPGYSVWNSSSHLPEGLLITAAEILCFDLLIQNPDRLPLNPNCLTNGSDLVIFDHELALVTEGVIGWRPPWEAGGADLAKLHLFFDHLRTRMPSLDRFAANFAAISDERIEGYGQALPGPWLAQGEDITDILGYIRELKVNLSAAINHLASVMR